MQRTRIILLCFLTQLAALSAPAQQSIFKTYSVSDGLVNNAVRKIYQDSKGFLWVSTWEGLSKFDGYRFTNFNETNGLSHNMVNDITENASGDVYVAMNNGSVDLIRNNRVHQKGIFQNVVINKFLPQQGGSMMALTDNSGIIKIKGAKFERIVNPAGISFYSIAELNDSLIAAAADTFPLFIFNKQFRTWSFIKEKIRGGVTNCVYKDLQGRLWLGTSLGLRLISVQPDKKKISYQALPPPFNSQLLSESNITAIRQEENGNFWIGTDAGLINISSTGQVLVLTEKDGLPSRSISSLFKDRENTLWIGTRQGLAKIISASPVPVYDPSSDFASLIKKISSEQLLILSGNSFYRYNFKTGQTDNILKTKKGKLLTYVLNSSPSLIIYDDRLYEYDNRNNQLRPLYNMPGSDTFFTANTFDQRHIFIGTFNGMVISSNGKIKKDSTFPMRITSLVADKKGFLWIGTWSEGLYRAKFDSTSNRFKEISHYTQLPDQHIRSLFEDSHGNIWVGTRFSGVTRITETAGQSPAFTHIDQQQGLSSNWIADMTEDAMGNIWLATMSGLDKLLIKGNNINVFNYSRIIHFFTNINIISTTENNKLICSSLFGMFQLIDAQMENYSPSRVFLTTVNVGDSINNTAIDGLSAREIVLPYKKNQASFEFTSPSYLNEKAILYSYRLKGSVDTSWSKPSNSHMVQYASLEPGHYKFEVRMLGWNGVYGPVTSFLFTIKPPYWSTWWFYSIIGVAIILILYSLYWYRINQLMHVQKVRTNIATDLHDDIGSTLTNISILSELSKKNLSASPVAEKYLQRITEESAASQQALDDIIWSVNSGNDNIQELQARMRRYVAEVFESSNVNCQFHFENPTESGKLNMEQRRDLYLVFKECLNNIYKHAGAKNIFISITVKNGMLQMLIKDDGKGFDLQQETHRNGLKNLKTRVEKWKGSIKIDTGKGKGAGVEINMPVKSSLLK